MSEAGTTELSFDDPRLIHQVAGQQNEHWKILGRLLGVRVSSSGHSVSIRGDEVQRELAGRVVRELYGVVKQGHPIYPSDVDYGVRILSSDRTANLTEIFLDTIYISANKRTITPKSINQKTYIDAIRDHDIVFGIGPAGTGKCVAGSTRVLTDRGLVRIDCLAEGTHAGETRPIHLGVWGLGGPEPASHFYDGGRSPTLRIRTRLGYGIEATPEHPLLRLGTGGEVTWRRADELRPGDFVAVQRGQGLFGSETRIDFEYRRNGRCDHSKPVRLEALDEEVAYVLGLLTGDGCLTFRNRVILSSADPEIVEAFRRFAERLGLHVFRSGEARPYDHIIASAQLYQLLLHLGLSAGKAAEKRVPGAVLRAPREIVAAFLRGLFDTDGTVSGRDGYPSLCSSSAGLIDDVQLLLLDFGILAATRLRRVRVGEGITTYHELEMRGRDADRFFDEIGFALDRKQNLRGEGRFNTNVDVVPYVGPMIHAAARAAMLTRAIHKRLYDYEIGRRAPSYAKLQEILGLLAACSVANEAWRRLEEMWQRNLFWAEIVSIEPGEAHVYDLTVPGTHSFCANGFVNHNTYLAMAMAVAALTKNEYARIILTRPAVEAGEKLGFLPGDLAEKVNPYLRPLYDALHDMVDFDRARKMIERGTIEVAPLAFMRGRTLHDSFVVLDEAQNTTPEQMKMFLTRLGFGSKTVVTGDVTQIDLPEGKRSGLKHAASILRGIEDIRFIHFNEKDVVRHRLVQEIIGAYERAEAAEEAARAEEANGGRGVRSEGGEGDRPPSPSPEGPDGSRGDRPGRE